MKYLNTFESYNFIANDSINKTKIKAIKGLSDLTYDRNLFRALNKVEYYGKMTIEDFIHELRVIYELEISSPNTTPIIGIAVKTSDKKLKSLLNSDSYKVIYNGYYIYRLD